VTQMHNKTVMITGASKGIGAQAARVFANAGANIVLLARSQPEIEELADEIQTPALAIECDVAIWSGVETAAKSAIAKFGKIDILINNAGTIQPISRLSESDPDAWGSAIDTNLKGVYYGARAVLPSMVANGGGTILTVSSGAAHSPVEAWSHYCSSKAGAAMLTRSIDLEERANGIRAIGLSPGTVATDMQKEIKKSGVNPVSKLNWSDHIRSDWPALTLLWMCGSQADEYLGEEIKLGDAVIRQRVGLTS